MGRQIHSRHVSLDRFVETPDHGRDRTAVDDEQHGSLDDQTRRIEAFIRQGFIVEHRVLVHPVIFGAGTSCFPPFDRPIGMRLAETPPFASDVACLGYQVIR